MLQHKASSARQISVLIGNKWIERMHFDMSLTDASSPFLRNSHHCLANSRSTLPFLCFVFFLFRFFSFTILKSLRSKVSFSSSTSTFTIYLFIQFCVFAWMRVRHCFGDPSFMSIANSFANCALRGIGFLGIIIGHWLLFLHRYLLRWIICFLFLFFFLHRHY